VAEAAAEAQVSLRPEESAACEAVDSVARFIKGQGETLYKDPKSFLSTLLKECRLTAAYTISFRAHTLVAEGFVH
jgi:hypothetical protein